MARSNKPDTASTLRCRNFKTQLISTVSPTVYTNPSRKRSFSKTLFKPEEFENADFAFSRGRKHFENVAFWKRWRHDNHVISLAEFSSNTNPKWSVIGAFLNSSGVVWTENIWCVFRVKPPFSNSSGVVWTGPNVLIKRPGKVRLDIYRSQTSRHLISAISNQWLDIAG